MRGTGDVVAWLVEGNVAVRSDAENGKVNPTGCVDRFLVASHLIAGACRQRVRQVPRRCGNVDVGEQVSFHEDVVALRIVLRDAPVFVEVECDHVPEGQPILAMTPGEVGVQADRRRAGWKRDDEAR